MSHTVYRLDLYWRSREKREDAGLQRKKRHSVESRLQPSELGFSAFLPESLSSSLLGSLSLSANFRWLLLGPPTLTPVSLPSAE